MKIQYASDLHLEMQHNSRWMMHNGLEAAGDILVLAGDIIYLGNEALLKHPFWDWASDNFDQVIVTPGNHEFYGGWNLAQLFDGWSMEVRHNIHYYYNSIVRIDDVEFVLTSLWSRISVQDAFACENGINDFRRIMSDGRLVDYVRFNEEHAKCREFVAESCKRPVSCGMKRVVVSHHLPSFKLVDPCFSGSTLNGAFVSDLDDIISSGNIDYWIYGHSHKNIRVKIGDCLCVSNQLGYVSNGEHVGFYRGCFLEL